MIGFLNTDWAKRDADPVAGGCGWNRMVMPAYHIENYGYEDCVVGEVGWDKNHGFVAVPPAEKRTKGAVLHSAKAIKVDTVILKLFMHKDAPAMVRRARDLGQTVIVDVDDHFENLPTYNQAFHNTDPKKHPENNRNFFHQSINEASGVITSSKFLQDRMLKRNRNSVLVRNAIEPDLFRKSLHYNPQTIGWIGGLAWREGDLKEVSNSVEHFMRKHPQIRFFHGGASSFKNMRDIIEIPESRYSEHGTLAPNHYGALMDSLDIGLVPLQNNTFNEAKSFLKGLEYAISGVPFIASPTYEYRYLNKQGVGLIAKRRGDWEKQLESLLNPKIYKSYSEAGYDIVMERHTYKQRTKEWIEAIEKIKSA